MSKPPTIEEVVDSLLSGELSWIHDQLDGTHLLKSELERVEKRKHEAIATIKELVSGDLVREIEKAYGGCHDCYGKGYATYRSAYIGTDTDQDIGGTGGRINQPFEEMRFCKCERGQQLKARLTPTKPEEQR